MKVGWRVINFPNKVRVGVGVGCYFLNMANCTVVIGEGVIMFFCAPQVCTCNPPQVFNDSSLIQYNKMLCIECVHNTSSLHIIIPTCTWSPGGYNGINLICVSIPRQISETVWRHFLILCLSMAYKLWMVPVILFKFDKFKLDQCLTDFQFDFFFPYVGVCKSQNSKWSRKFLQTILGRLCSECLSLNLSLSLASQPHRHHYSA